MGDAILGQEDKYSYNERYISILNTYFPQWKIYKDELNELLYND